MVVGRAAAHIASLLTGKHKPIYNPAVECGDNVLVTNAERIKFTGKKFDQKHYRWHTGYPGGLQVYPVRRMYERHPQRVLWKAVYGMLPKVALLHSFKRLCFVIFTVLFFSLTRCSCATFVFDCFFFFFCFLKILFALL
jgi:ribosomal protein L13